MTIQPNPKPSLILVHGFRGSPHGLEAIAKDLRQAGYTVHIPAVPPFAGAKLPSENNPDYTPKAYTKYLYNYIKTQGITHPILIGHSMGSIIVTATAQHYPNLTHQKLILLSPISVKPPKIIAQLSPLANHLPRRIVDYITTRFLFVPHDKKLFKETIRTTHQCSNDIPPSKAELSSTMKFSTEHSVADFLQGVDKNITIIAGTTDRLISQKHTKRLAEKYGAQLKLIPQAGHLHNYEKPHETAKLILETLREE